MKKLGRKWYPFINTLPSFGLIPYPATWRPPSGNYKEKETYEVRSWEEEGDIVVLCNGAGVAPLGLTGGVYIPVHALRGYGVTCIAAPGRLRDGPGSTFVVGAGLVISRIPDPAPGLRSPQPADLSDFVFDDKRTFEPSRVAAIAAKRARWGQLRFSSFGEMVRHRAPPSQKIQTALDDLVLRLCPGVADHCDWEGRARWYADRPITPDGLPLVGPTRLPRLYCCCGHGFHGWKAAAATAGLLADGLDSGWDGDAGRYAPSRFAPFRAAPRPADRRPAEADPRPAAA